ncbi:toll/interleukin-1 receptor domain-containing protein [Gimesia maris]|uniref:toll/interleukin-1 receptor domain-containing protein n=1 Tax=Gimesia maris TaxID=122 RepID=UPI0030D9B467
MDTQSKTYDVFLSYNSRDHVMVDQIAHWLKEQGISCFLDRWYLVPGKPWPVALEDALQRSKSVVILLGPGEMGHWQQREYYLALDLQKNYNISVIPVLLPGADPALGFLSLNTWVDLRNGLHDKHSLNVLSAAIAGQSPVKMVRETLTTLDSICPYRGLLSYREEDAPFFFGRETCINQLFETLNQHSFVAVLGSSGSGKSSVVRAGLVPHLRQNGNGTVWEIITLVPGDRPLRALAEALIPLLTSGISEIDSLTEVNKLAKCFLDGSVKLRDVVERALEKQPGTDRLLVIVDQWEELYTLCQNNKMIVSFIDQLLDASDNANCSVISTCRGDFSGLMLDYRPLVDRIQESQVLISSMNKEELQQAIEKPAEKVGLVIEPGLVQRILNDLDHEPGNLPLLSFLLEQLWDHRRGKYLVNEAYDAMQGVEGAITIKAEEVFNSLSPDQQELLPKIFIQLVSVGNESNDTRRRAKILTEDHIEQSIIKLMTDKRLFVTSRDSEIQTVEVAHEALISNWKRSQHWIDNIRGFLIWRKRFTPFVEEWKVNPESLLRGGSLGEAKDWLAIHSQDLDKDEIKFIEASIERQVQELNEEQKTRRQLTSRLKIAISGVIGTLCLSIGLIVSLTMVYNEKDKTNKLLVNNKKLLSDTTDLLTKNEKVLLEHYYMRNANDELNAGNYSKAIVWFYRTLTNARKPEYEKWSSKALMQISTWSRVIGQPLKNEGIISAVAFSPDGNTVAAASYDSTACLWSVSDRQPIGKPLQHKRSIVAVSFSPDGNTVATASLDKTARLWDATNGLSIAPPLQHEDSVVAVAFSPDGKTVATASSDKTVRLWNTANGKPIAPPLQHQDFVVAVSFSPDGKTVAAACGDETARLWDVVNNKTIGKPLHHDGIVVAVAFSPDGKTVATASNDRTARLWDATNGQPIVNHLQNDEPIVLRHDGIVNDVAFSPDGKTIATASNDKTARLWDVPYGRPIGTPLQHEDSVKVVAFSPDGKSVATASNDKTARLWDAEYGQPMGNPLQHEDSVIAVAYSPDGKTMATASKDTVRLRNILRHPLKHASFVLAVTFSPDGKTVATAGKDTAARLWDTVNGQQIGNTLRHVNGVSAVAFSPDSKIVATASDDKTVRLWDAANGNQIRIPFQHERSVMAVAFSPDGKIVATASNDATARLWDATSGTQIGTPLEHQGSVVAVAFSPDGKTLATASFDKTARLWDMSNGKQIGKSLQHADYVRAVAFSPDGKTVATASNDATARLWDATNGKQISNPIQHEDSVVAVTFSPDGKIVATASTDTTACLWDATNGAQIGKPLQHQGSVVAVAFSPDGKIVATASNDTTACLWNVANGQSIGKPLQHLDIVRAVAFSPDGKTVVTASNDTTARLWKIFKPAQDIDELLKLSIEVRTTYKIDESDSFKHLTQKEWLDKSHELNRLGGPCDIVP